METQEFERLISRISELETRLDSIMAFSPFHNTEKLSLTLENVIKKTSRETEKLSKLNELVWLQRFVIFCLLCLGVLLMWLAK